MTFEGESEPVWAKKDGTLAAAAEDERARRNTFFNERLPLDLALSGMLASSPHPSDEETVEGQDSIFTRPPSPPRCERRAQRQAHRAGD
ncbi:hypothetical protein AAFF_G00418870 [Aldrovandia affinis]|uniref:Uncharacterized protein n=1 Tax=Aldrovandia affinis TaxID=143900 RepID=A0AAD7SA05_9TELE|nr:hypothetical protein AAFF_G00418870 [Aldrovandia affinis]